MYDELLQIAYEKSDEIIKQLNCEKFVGILDTQKIVEAVSKSIPCKIKVSSTSFDKLSREVKPNNRTIMKKCGAMMLTTIYDEENVNVAHIVLNHDMAPEFQRFSLVHELGHLMTDESGTEIFNHDSGYVLSTHIDYEITSMPRDMYADNLFFRKEQLANIFALRVLMPKTAFYSELDKSGNIKDIAERFGLSEAAVISRIRLVE